MNGSLVPYQPHADGALFRLRGLLAALERRLRDLEREYAQDVERIRHFERRYRPAVGDRYDELERLRERTNHGWAALGKARSHGFARAEEPDEPLDDLGASAPRPGGEARRLFLFLARQIHPDLATDESERERRHEVMAEATLAYRDNNDRRLQWLLEHWQAESQPILGFGYGSQWSRTNRQIAWARYRIRELQYSLGQLHSSPVARIMHEHEIARSSGRNLILDMRRQIQAELEEAYQEADRLRAAIADLPPELRTAVESGCGP